MVVGVIKRVYNLHNKQLLKYFSSILCCDQFQMSDHLDNSGDVSITIEHFFSASQFIDPLPEHQAKLTIESVDKFLGSVFVIFLKLILSTLCFQDKLSNETTEKAQESLLRQITGKCCLLEMRVLMRLMKHDLRMNAGAKPVLDALDPRAYEAFQTSRNLDDVVTRVMNKKDSPKLSKQLRSAPFYCTGYFGIKSMN